MCQEPQLQGCQQTRTSQIPVSLVIFPNSFSIILNHVYLSEQSWARWGISTSTFLISLVCKITNELYQVKMINKTAYLTHSPHRLAGGTDVKEQKGAATFTKGGYDYTSYSIYLADKIWEVNSPYTLTGPLADNKIYTTRITALRACVTNSQCSGQLFTYSIGIC